MTFTETEISILKNFARINPAMIIHSDRLEVLSPTKSIVGKYEFENPYDFESYGIYEVPKFLQAVETFDNVSIEVGKKFLTLKEGNAKIKYWTTDQSILPQVPDVEPNFTKVDKQLDFDLPADKLAALFKAAQVLRGEFVFFQSDENGIRLTIANDIDASEHSFDVLIRDNVRSNELGDSVLRIKVSELKVVAGDYKIAMSDKGISKWECFNGVTYYIGCKKV